MRSFVLALIWLSLPDAPAAQARFDPAAPPPVTRWPAASDPARFLRAPGGATAIVAPGLDGTLESYRSLLEQTDGQERRRRFRVVSADRATRADLSGPILVVGPVGPLIRAYLDRAPVRPDPIAKDETVRVAGVNPWDPSSPMVVLTGADDKLVLKYLARPESYRAADYEVIRDGLRVRYGRYAGGQGGPWRLDPLHDVDLRERLVWIQEKEVRVGFFRGEISEGQAHALAGSSAGVLRSFLDRLGQEGTLPRVELIVYPDVEAKALRTDDSRPSHFDARSTPRVHLIASSGEDSWDRIGLARAAATTALGMIGTAAVADGVSVWLAGGLMGRELDWWEARLDRAGVLPPVAELLDDARYAQRTYLAGMPAAGLLVRRLSHNRSAGELRALLRDPDRLRAAATDKAPREKAGELPARTRRPLPFQKGVGLAHEGYAVVDGYGSRSSTDSMTKLKSLGVEWVALSPYGFMRDPAGAEIRFPRNELQNPGGENDRAVLATIDAAHRLGLRVMLKPQLWLGGGRWTGDILMPTEDTWWAFFTQYREFLTHYALLAAAGDADILVVGVEMQSTTPREADWRKLIALSRELYEGPLTYAANWGEEFERIGFWDALDYAGLDCYYPLSSEPEADDRRLAEGARMIANRIAAVAHRAGRPVLLTEVGLPALSAAWTSPHDDRSGRAQNDDAQARGYKALLSAFWGQPWLAGLYWWKWPTTPPGRRHEPLFSPRGRPAERVLADWYAMPRPSVGDWPADGAIWSSPISLKP